MEIFKILDKLKEEHKNDTVIQKNGTMLIKSIQLGKWNKYKYELFEPFINVNIKMHKNYNIRMYN